MKKKKSQFEEGVAELKQMLHAQWTNLRYSFGNSSGQNKFSFIIISGKDIGNKCPKFLKI